MGNITPRFKLKNSKQNPALIILKCYFDGVRFTYSTGENIDPEYWGIAARDEPYKIIYPRQGKGSKEIRESLHLIADQLDRYKNEINKIYNQLKRQGIKPSTDRLKSEMDKIFKVQNPKEEIYNLNEFISQFIIEIETGKRITENTKEKYKYGTVKNYKGFEAQLAEYQKNRGRTLNFKDITIDFYDDFINYFNSKNYSTNTIGRHIKCLKTLMRISKEQGLHSNEEFQRKKFMAVWIDTQNIYLTEKEIQRIHELDLSNDKRLDLIRDVFLVGCYTALRYSDYSRITHAHIRQTPKGNLVIDMITKKTGEQVIIPITPELNSILKKYDYNLPLTHEQKVNKEIKRIGKKANIDDDIIIESTKGGLKVIQTIKKHDLIKTHTARRSGATNMYKAGVKTIDIMKITGHTLESNFLKYIKVTKEETADILAEHPYFSRNAQLTIAK